MGSYFTRVMMMSEGILSPGAPKCVFKIKADIKGSLVFYYMLWKGSTSKGLSKDAAISKIV
jgi:hypothetical protein